MAQAIEELHQPEPDLRDLLTAAHRTVHDYPGGAYALAPLLGKAPNALSNEVNQNVRTHKLGLADSTRLQLFTDDFSILHSQAAALGHTCIPLGDFSGISDAALLECYADWHKEIGDVAKAVAQALLDGEISREEYQRIAQEGREQIQRFHVFLSRVEGLVVD